MAVGTKAMRAIAIIASRTETGLASIYLPPVLQMSGEVHCREITLAALPAEIQNGHALAFITGK